MLCASNDTPSPNPVPAVVRLFRHSKRAQWGLAAIVWEGGGKRGYRFEDGSERVFKEGFYHLFESAPAVGEAAESLLASIHRDRMDASGKGSKASALPVRGPALHELVAVFRELYPDGFADSKWVSTRRGSGPKRRAKRHRDPALEEAGRALAADALDDLLRAGQEEAVLQRVVAVLGATDLVTKSQLEVLRKATPSRALAQALRDLMHEPDPDGIRFDEVLTRLVRSSSGRPSWSLMTAIRALVDPHHDICIRPSVFFDAVRVVSPSQAKKVSPQGGQYERLAAIARDFQQRLRDAGLAPRDMLDVQDFIWETMRPAAAPVLARVRQRAAEDAAAAATKVETPEGALLDAEGPTAEAA